MQRLRAIVDHPAFHWSVIVIIGLNALVLAMDALPSMSQAYGDTLMAIDQAILWIFVVELALRLIAYREKFFTDPWSIFDFAVVAISFVPAAGGIQALRALRVFRVLRLISAFPRLRSVVSGLLKSIPGIASVALLLLLFVFVAAILATNFYGTGAPHLFGDLWTSMFTLFKVMTLEGWPDIADQVMAVYPSAWLFFLIYILVTALTVLNFFVAIIVNAMEAEALENKATIQMQEDLMTEIRALRSDLDAFRQETGRDIDELEDRLERDKDGDG